MLLLAGLLLLAIGVGPASAKGQPPCWKTLINDWYDGRIDGTYPIKCYRDALNHLPTDVDTYSSARDDIKQALQERITQSRKSGGGIAERRRHVERRRHSGGGTSGGTSGGGTSGGGGTSNGGGASQRRSLERRRHLRRGREDGRREERERPDRRRLQRGQTRYSRLRSDPADRPRRGGAAVDGGRRSGIPDSPDPSAQAPARLRRLASAAPGGPTPKQP